MFSQVQESTNMGQLPFQAGREKVGERKQAGSAKDRTRQIQRIAGNRWADQDLFHRS